MGILSIVATPIGNLEDITLRALRTLREADAILCEDTRVTSKLLAKYEISKPLIRCDEKMEGKTAEQAIGMLEDGQKLALVSDAGTPGISDPGARLVKKVREAGQRIEVVPGPSAVATMVSLAGIDEFLFLGFLPHKKGRKTAIENVKTSKVPVVVYESPYRVDNFFEGLGERVVSVGRELTKLHEEYLEGTAHEVLKQLRERDAVRGEFVIIVHPR